MSSYSNDINFVLNQKVEDAENMVKRSKRLKTLFSEPYKEETLRKLYCITHGIFEAGVRMVRTPEDKALLEKYDISDGTIDKQPAHIEVMDLFFDYIGCLNIMLSEANDKD